MNNDFDKELREMAKQSKVKESEELRDKIKITCNNLDCKKSGYKKHLSAAAVFIGVFVIVGVYLPTYANDTPIVKKVIEYFNGNNNAINEAYIENSYEEKNIIKAEGYTLEIESLYYDRSELSVFYKIRSEKPFDKNKEYDLAMEFKQDNEESILLRTTTFEFIDDYTMIIMASCTLASENYGELPEVLTGELTVGNLSILDYKDETIDLESVEINSKSIEISLDSKGIEVINKEIDKVVYLDGGYAKYIKSIISPTRINLELSRMGGDFFTDYLIEEYIWDSKKGALKELYNIGGGYYNSDNEYIITREFESPSEEGDLLLVPYIFTSGPYGNGDEGRATIKEYEFKEGETLDLGQYGTMEIEKIEYKENETIMTIKTTGLICFEPFLNTMLNDNDNKWYMPTAVINREVYGFLDMKADYVFEKMDSVKEYSLKVMEPNRIEIIEEEIINLRSYTTTKK